MNNYRSISTPEKQTMRISKSALFCALLLVSIWFSAAPKSFAIQNQPGSSFNADYHNTTGRTENDFHVLIQGDGLYQSLTTYEGGQVPFPKVEISYGNGTAEISWSGASVMPGQVTHVGVAGPAFTIVDSWWTIDGQRDKPNPYYGTLLTPYFSASDFFTVVRVSLFDDPLGTHQIGTDWAEGFGEFSSLANETPDGPVFASYATLFSPTEIPLQDLNSSLTGFGPESQIMSYQAMGTPEPGTLVLLGSTMAGLGRLLRRKLLG